VLSLRHGQIPGHPALARPTSHLDWDRAGLRVPTALTDWPEKGRPRRAGVSSFGFSGTNAHVILEQAPEPEPRARRPESVVVLPLSARTPEALEEASRALADWLEAAPRDLRDVAYTLGVGRTAFPHRRAVVGAEAKALARALRGDAKATGEGRLANLAVAWEAGGDVDWRRLYGRGEARLVAVPGHPFHPQSYWPEPASAGAGPAQLPVRIEDWRTLLDAEARRVLGATRSGPLDPDAALVDQGFTSLLGLELRRALEGALGRSLPVGLLYDYPTLNRMAAWLAGSAEVPRPAPAPAAAPDLDFLDTLSMAELAELIEREVE
jgi:acyl transferase domain-containing protein